MICVTCKAQFPILVKIDGKLRNLSNRSHCLECNPFKSHKRQVLTSTKVCSKCEEEKLLSEFYQRKDTTPTSYCKSCQNQNVVDRQRLWKFKAVEYKGGKCVRCGYNKCPGALDFHHEDPTMKEFSLGSGRLKLLESSKAELDKCILLCANCHREEHWGHIGSRGGIRTHTPEDNGF